MSKPSFIIWLSLLSAAVGALFWLLHSGPDKASIGGGGYDLGPFLYSWMLVFLSGFWTVIAFVAGLRGAKSGPARRGYILAGLGMVVFTLTLWLHGADLN